MEEVTTRTCPGPVIPGRDEEAEKAKVYACNTSHYCYDWDFLLICKHDEEWNACEDFCKLYAEGLPCEHTHTEES